VAVLTVFIVDFVEGIFYCLNLFISLGHFDEQNNECKHNFGSTIYSMLQGHVLKTPWFHVHNKVEEEIIFKIMYNLLSYLMRYSGVVSNLIMPVV